MDFKQAMESFQFYNSADIIKDEENYQLTVINDFGIVGRLNDLVKLWSENDKSK